MNNKSSCNKFFDSSIISVTASLWTKDGQYRNDLDLSISDRNRFRFLKKELKKYDLLLNQKLFSSNDENFSLIGRHFIFPNINLCGAEKVLNQLRKTL